MLGRSAHASPFLSSLKAFRPADLQAYLQTCKQSRQQATMYQDFLAGTSDGMPVGRIASRTEFKLACKKYLLPAAFLPRYGRSREHRLCKHQGWSGEVNACCPP